MSKFALLALTVPSNAPALQTTAFLTRCGTNTLRPQLVQRHEMARAAREDFRSGRTLIREREARTRAISFSRAAGVVRGHGYMTEPPSRQYEAYKANGWPNEVAEYDPHGVAAGGMYADCDGCRSRDWFGPNPWSEPGSAKHLDFVMGGSGGNILGVCGASPSRAVHESMSR